MDLSTEAQRLHTLILHWCPKNLHHEGMPNTLARAFMHATACAADQRRMLEGKAVIRPLDSFPDPLFLFDNLPTGTANGKPRTQEQLELDPYAQIRAFLRALPTNEERAKALKKIGEGICQNE